MSDLLVNVTTAIQAQLDFSKINEGCEYHLESKPIILLYSCNAQSKQWAGDIPCPITVFVNKAGYVIRNLICDSKESKQFN